MYPKSDQVVGKSGKKQEEEIKTAGFPVKKE
jgi:hypothetical protein